MTPSTAGSPSERIVRELLAEHWRTFAEELGIDLSEDSPDPWFRLLCFALLCSTRIGTGVAVRAAHDLTAAGWSDAAAMASASWEDLVRVLDDAGYVRYDVRTARRLELLSRRVLDVYGGDLRGLREVAGRSPGRERKLLQEFAGIGPVGADVFLREAQAAWSELQPYVDARTRETACELGLPADAERLAALVPSADLARLVAAVVRHRIARRHQPAGRPS